MASDLAVYQGSCDASGVVDVGGKFFAAGTDERNAVRVYEAGGNGQAVATLPLDKFLRAKWDEKDEEYKECDIEGATRIGDVTLWITSHGRNAKGKEKPERRRLFALKIVHKNAGVALEPYGKPYDALLEDFLHAKALKAWRLAEAAEKSPQKKDGLNIEGICAMPDGGVWVGFRNPIRDGKALLVGLEKPMELVQKDGAHADIGKVRELDLGGRGFRDMVRWKDGYLILAGAYDGERKFALFRWKGGDGVPMMLPTNLNATGLAPEGLVMLPDNENKVLILSDDDSLPFDGTINGKLPDEKRTFRGLFVSLEE